MVGYQPYNFISQIKKIEIIWLIVSEGWYQYKTEDFSPKSSTGAILLVLPNIYFQFPNRTN